MSSSCSSVFLFFLFCFLRFYFSLSHCSHGTKLGKLENLSLGEDEEEEVVVQDENQPEERMEERVDLSLCLVGRFWTEKPIRSHIMKDRMGDIWRQGRGVNIKEIEKGLFLF